MKRYIGAAVRNILDEPEEIKRKLACDPDTRVDILQELAKDDTWGVQVGLARNPSTPVEILNDLIYVSDIDVRRSVAGNPSTPVETLRKLANCGTDVGCALAQNPNTPKDMLLALAERNNYPINLSLIENPELPLDILYRFILGVSFYPESLRNFAKETYVKRTQGGQQK